ncbi:MAG: hypothetical protein ABII21_02245 [bacterium]
MKKLLALVVFLFVFAGVTSAHEGSVDLTSGTVSCKGISIYQDGYYRVSGRCDGLVYPYETTYNKYVLWGKTSVGGQMTRIAEIDCGYFSGNIATAFDGMYVTAEQNSLVRKPSTKQVLEGKVTLFNFDKSQVTTAPTTSTTTTATTAKDTVDKATTTVSSTAGAVVGKIVTSLLVVILVIVGLAIGASLLFRSRGSVSA